MIEDDDSVREIARRVLTDAGYTVIEARYGSEALDLLPTGPRSTLSSATSSCRASPTRVSSAYGDASGDRPALHVRYAPESAGPIGDAELVRKPFTAAERRAAIGRASAQTRPSSTQPLWPPRPIAFESATSSSTSRASFGT